MKTPEEIGKEILERIIQRKVNPGGMGTELTGAKGSGKTSLFLNFAEIFSKKYPKELLMWREAVESPIQFIKFPHWNLYVEEGVNLRILDQNDGGREMNVPYKTFEPLPEVSYDTQKMEKHRDLFKENQERKRQQNGIFSGLCRMMRGGQLNVVYFNKLQFWIDFLRYLRSIPKWQTLFIDEYEDLFPSYNIGELWKRIEWTKNNFKQIRKGLVNVFVNTQAKTDVDWRIRVKMDVWGYLFGAVPDMVSPIKKQAVSNLNVGGGWLDWGRSLYGKINFLPYEAKENEFYVAVME